MNKSLADDLAEREEEIISDISGLIESAELTPSQIHILYNIIDKTYRHGLETNSCKRNEDYNRIGFLGRLHEKKRVETYARKI